MSHITLRIVTVAALAACAIITADATAANTAAGAKQRVAFTGTFDTNTGTGTWRLVPLTKGPLKADSGTISGSGKVVGRTLRNGQRVTLIEGGDSLLGKYGSFGISQTVASTQVAPGLSADIGTWRFHAGIGAYEHVSGGGRFAAVGLASGVVHVSQEGWLTIR